MESVTNNSDSTAGKRKRSPSSSSLPPSAPPAKTSKTSSSSLSINYLARQSQDDLPLLNKDDPLPNLLHLLSAYSNVLDRHESLASNLGARPLGPILIKRFERCFDAPPKVVASHHKGATGIPEDAGHQITWLEVIEFARSHPGQFTLSTFSEGKRVCQFYYPQKQLRVQISEEDFLFINSGRCQELIPPLPIWEDEEKEVGTCDVLEVKLKELTNVADMVAARTRQLSHRLKGRRAAILERRAEGGSGTPAKASALQTTTAPPSSSNGGFVAVNTANARVNGESETGASAFAGVRSELLRHFESLPHNQNQSRAHARHPSMAMPDSSQQGTKHTDAAAADPSGSARAASTTSSLSPVPAEAFSNDVLSYYTSESAPASRHVTNSTSGPQQRPSSSAGYAYNVGHTPVKHNFSRPLPPALESSQPFRPLCQAHMDNLPRGHRVLPPCDRCRRLRMDCVKNLTSCAGCTKKHARCHWREVSREEVGALDHLMESAYPDTTAAAQFPDLNGYGNGPVGGLGDDLSADESDDDDSNPLEDLEALGEKEEREKELADQRLREDEEGLRNARELSRQGWEDGLRSTHASEAVNGVSATRDNDADLAEATTSTEPPIAHEEVSNQSNPDRAAVIATSVERSPDVPIHVSEVQDHANSLTHATETQSHDEPRKSAFVPLPSELEQRRSPPNHGGFRAVNEPLSHGSTATVHQTSWRTM